MAKAKNTAAAKKALAEKKSLNTRLRKGDEVMVVTGGNQKSGRDNKGARGKIMKFLPKKDRVIVEGVNMVSRHKRATNSMESGGKVAKEGSIHISNVMYYHAELKRPVRLKINTLEDGRKVRGFINPESKKFEQIDVE